MLWKQAAATASSAISRLTNSPSFTPLSHLLAPASRLLPSRFFSTSSTPSSPISPTTPAAAPSSSSPSPPPPKEPDFFVFRLLKKIPLGPRFDRWMQPVVVDVDLRHLLSKALAFTTYGLVGAVCLSSMGVDIKPLLAPVGLISITLGFALKDIATNFLSGILLVSLNRPFKRGQHVIIGRFADAVEGTFLRIDLRYTYLKNIQTGAILAVPNSIVVNSTILVRPPTRPLDSSEL